MTRWDAMTRAAIKNIEIQLAKRYKLDNPECDEADILKCLQGAHALGLVDIKLVERIVEENWPNYWKDEEVSSEEAENVKRFEARLAVWEGKW